MDRLGFFKHGLSSVMEAAQAVVGLKKAAETFTEVVDEALRDISPGLGLYLPSIDAAMYDSPSGTLYEVGQMGYTKVEAGCYYEGTVYGVKPEEFLQMAKSSGLKVLGLHLNKFYEKESQPQESEPTEQAEGDIATSEATFLGPQATAWWEKALECARAMNCRFVTMSKFPEEVSEQTIEEYAEYFNLVGAMAKERGIQFCFHPSKAELQPRDESSIFEELAKRCHKELVWFELDSFDAHKAGADMCKMMQTHADRVIALHLHDYDITCESGKIDFNKIMSQAEKSKIEEVFVEVRSFPLPPQNCAERSLRNVEMLDSVKI